MHLSRSTLSLLLALVVASGCEAGAPLEDAAE